MASLFTRPNSHFFWVKFRDPATGDIKRASTKIRSDAPDGRRRALQIVNDHTRRELETPRHDPQEAWPAWVPAFIEQRYAHSPKTLLRVKNAWSALIVYLDAHKLYLPRLVTYAGVVAYLPWRLSAHGPKHRLRKVKHNTAVLEVKFLSVILREAVRRGFAIANPCRELEVRRVSTKQKEEITGDQQTAIETALADPSTPQWMREHWLVLMRQGCRCAEAAAPLDRIDDDARTITLRLKGGKLFTAPLHADLLPLVARARDEHRKTLVEVPDSAPKRWHTFFHKRLNLPLSIHCTRVTVITRLLRAGYTPAEVCAYVGHSEEVNVIYRRLRPSDVRRLGSALGDSPSPAAGNDRLRIVA